MEDLITEPHTKMSEGVKVGDVLNIGGLRSTVERVLTNKTDQMVWHLTIENAATKSRSKMMLIIPKKIPVIILN